MIYFYVYPSAFQDPGGGEILLLKTRQYLARSGMRVSLFNMWEDRLREGDLLHVFGSVKEALGLMETAKVKGVTIVHSPIIWYNWQSAFHTSYRLDQRFLCVLRQIVKTVLPAVPSARRKMMQLADLVLAASHMEARQIARYFSIPRARIRVVTYGAEQTYEGASRALFESKFGLRNFILTVGRIEPRKNQLQLIRAVSRLDRDLVVVGNPVSNYMNYYEKCRQEATSRTHFLGHLGADSDVLRSAYAACDVFILGSWFETPGLAALEAGLAGAKVVITQGGSTREYFGDLVDYINPASVADIQAKLLSALKKEKTNRLQSHIRKHFLWQHTATQTVAIYRSLNYQPDVEMISAKNVD